MALGRVVVVDSCLPNRPGPVRRPVIFFSVSDLVRNFSRLVSTDCAWIVRANLLCEPSLDAVLAMLLEPLSARCGISPNENNTGRNAGST